MFTLAQHLDHEADNDDGQLIESREDAPNTIEPLEQVLHLVALLAQFAVTLLKVHAVTLRQHHGAEAGAKGKLA